MIKVLVYDDNKIRIDGLKSFIQLSEGLEYMGGFENCANIIDEVGTVEPHIILMDIEMPVKNGIEGVLLVKKHYPSVKIIIQTAFDDDEKVFAALQAGAEGYILKSASLTQIAQSIDEVMKGGAFMTPSIALKVMGYFGKQKIEITSDYKLSPKENEVLKWLAQGHSYKMIADEMGIAYFTVNNHVKKVYEKLRVHSLGEAVAIAHKDKLI